MIPVLDMSVNIESSFPSSWQIQQESFQTNQPGLKDKTDNTGVKSLVNEVRESTTDLEVLSNDLMQVDNLPLY
jgi:hypothetical protein